uniref:t-SNARE coiled-coil homology domain-containing protein n=1 Tax=Zooxanthella nutricula TaxID=1333877 RepID=A0A7S2LZT8_9DINO|mmetsp:Transcript_67970/g.208254  ORF Transcript_67970/g.208254 Transcript_67970/m.208254 type:complete len:316 (+) Transcript_67970:2-949(+)
MAPPPAPPIVRNLTSTFVRYRHDRRNSKGFRSMFAGDAQQTSHRLLDRESPQRGLGSGDVEMAVHALPPQWTDSAEEARDEIKQIRERLVALAKAHQKRLLKVFVDDAAPDREVESISTQVSSLVRRCEQHIHQVKTRGEDSKSQKEAQCRENVQRNLATQLQMLSQQFRQAQKDYMGEIRKRQRGGNWDDGPGDCRGDGGPGGDVGFSDAQMQELDAMEVNANQRSQEIVQIATSINDLHTIFKELAVLVIDQGSILDRIDYNIEQVVSQSQEANKQLKKAEDSQKSNRAMKCIIILVVIDLILILILIAKTRA